MDWVGLMILIELGNEMIMQEPSILPVVDSPKYSAAQKKYHIQYNSVNKTLTIETKKRSRAPKTLIFRLYHTQFRDETLLVI